MSYLRDEDHVRKNLATSCRAIHPPTKAMAVEKAMCRSSQCRCPGCLPR